MSVLILMHSPVSPPSPLRSWYMYTNWSKNVTLRATLDVNPTAQNVYQVVTYQTVFRRHRSAKKIQLWSLYALKLICREKKFQLLKWNSGTFFKSLTVREEH